VQQLSNNRCGFDFLMARKLGPYSGESTITMMDGRTKEARQLRGIREALVAHVGGAPSATQHALIERAVQLSLRITLMDQRFADAGRMGDIEGKQYLAWSNALNRTMRELGLKAAPQRAPSLAELFPASPPRPRPAAAQAVPEAREAVPA